MGSPNTLLDLNDHLFCQMERLNDDGLSDEELMREVKRAKAMSQIAGQVVRNAAVLLNAQKFSRENDWEEQKTSRILIGDESGGKK